ncbi:MAG: lysine 2,3-aminomutase [Pseudonocardiales bacterium]|nr:lysine 2,3-aminomutase [Pseudonocardiales bacterium]
MLEYTHRADFAGSLYGVNPAAPVLDLPGVTTVVDLADIAEPVDLAVIALPAKSVSDVVDQCAALGVGDRLPRRVWRRQPVRISKRGGKMTQPYQYPPQREFIEPDWRRIPGYRVVDESDWLNARWQRQHTVRNPAAFKQALGDLLPDSLAESIRKDQAKYATMSMGIPPYMIATMRVEDLWRDPVRRYMAPAFDDRAKEFPSHPTARQDTLREHEMWVAEGLIHKYPTKVLVEFLTTCPQYCAHCFRMDLIGLDVPQVAKRRIAGRGHDRFADILDYLRATPSVRDVVISGGDVANAPINQLEDFLVPLFAIESIRDVRLATKGIIGLPQHFLQDDVLRGMERIAAAALANRVELSIHAHINHANSVTPLVAKAVGAMLDLGVRDVRLQGVLLRGVNDTTEDLLDLCFTVRDQARIMPYYLHMCDLVPNAEHWRTTLGQAQELQQSIMGYLPGFATPRLMCEPPMLGKRLVHQEKSYDRVRGISYWTKNYRTSMELDDADALTREYRFYDPVDLLPEEGKEYWRQYRRE